MATIYFITHPDVKIQSDVDVRMWDLSPVGVAKVQAMLTQPWIRSITKVYSSAEQKAKTTAIIIGQLVQKDPTYIAELGEIDRTASGYMAHDVFEKTVQEFFAKPQEKVRGWERAIDAQRRIIVAVNTAVDALEAGDNALVVSHGGVGALLLSYLSGQPISAGLLPPGQGFYITFDKDWHLQTLHWQPIEQVAV